MGRQCRRRAEDTETRLAVPLYGVCRGRLIRQGVECGPATRHPGFHGCRILHERAHSLHRREMRRILLLSHLHTMPAAHDRYFVERLRVKCQVAGSAELGTGHRFHRRLHFFHGPGGIRHLTSRQRI